MKSKGEPEGELTELFQHAFACPHIQAPAQETYGRRVKCPWGYDLIFLDYGRKDLTLAKLL